MKIKPHTVAIVAAVGVVGFLLWRARRAIGETLSTTLNPASDQNAAYRAVNAVGGTVTGQGDGFSLGSYIYDLFNDDPDVTGVVSLTPRSTYWNPNAPGDSRTEYVTAGIGGDVLTFGERFQSILDTLNPFGATQPARSEYVTRNAETAGIAQAPRILPTF